MGEPDEKKIEAYQLRRIAGYKELAVAARFSVSRNTIQTWCKEVAAWLKLAKREEVDTLRAELTERYEHIYRSALDGFRRSQKREVVKTTKTSDEGDSETVRETPKAGQPAFLSVASNALLSIGKLWDADMKMSDRRSDTRCVGKSQTQMIDDQMKKLAKMKASLMGGSGDGDRA